MRRRTEMSNDGKYRYLLVRHWNEVVPIVYARVLTVCMLNPSTADGDTDDATIRWLIGWAMKRSYDAMRVVNLAAYRATSPKVMLAADDPHGPANASYLYTFTLDKQVLCAWGALGPKLPRYNNMILQLQNADLQCLDMTQNGQPVHPLRRSHRLEMMPWVAI